MKKIYFILILTMILFFQNHHKCRAQLFLLNQTTLTYSDIDNSTSVNNGAIWSNIGWSGWKIPLGFTYNFLNANFDSLYISNGWIHFNRPYIEGKLIIRAFSGNNGILQDKGSSTSQSPISYKLENNTPGQRILKIQWKNAGFINGNINDSVNVQLWLFETTNCFEVHIGSNNVSAGSYTNGATGPSIGVYTEGLGYCYATGNPLSATINTTPYYLNSTPPADIVYRFCPNSSGIESINNLSDLIIFPTITSDFITLNSASLFSDCCTLEIINEIGSIIRTSNIKGNNIIQIDVQNLPSGFYILKFNYSKGFVTKSFIKK